MTRKEITIPNKLYGDRTFTGYAFDITVGSFTFEAIVYKSSPKSWTVSLGTNSSYIAEGATKKSAIEAAQDRMIKVGEYRVRFSVENAK